MGVRERMRVEERKDGGVRRISSAILVAVITAVASVTGGRES